MIYNINHIIFMLGAVVKVACVIFMTPDMVHQWFAPFLENSVSFYDLDPWHSWIALGGSKNAFPYGYAMWLSFLPYSVAFYLLSIPIYLAYSFTLLTFDILLLVVLDRIVPGRRTFLLVTYWISPIVILATYVFGLNDIVPILFLIISLYFIDKLQLGRAGFFSVLAVSAKLSMILAIPFLFIYLLNARALHQLLPRFLLGGVFATFLVVFPFLFSKDGLEMVVTNQAIDRVYELRFLIGENIIIYVVPVVYFLTLYAFWRIKKINFEIFQSMLGISMLSVVLLSPSSWGWYVWVLPFLVIYQSISGRVSMVLCSCFALCFSIVVLMTLTTSFNTTMVDVLGVPALNELHSINLLAFLHTAMFAIGMLLVVRIARETIGKNDFFRISRRPFAIGIAGDSGSGKDTLADAMEGLFGKHSVTKLSGDDYHLWDRRKLIWRAMTHLNPMANDLESFANDLVYLMDGKKVMAYHYNHDTGIRSEKKAVKSNNFIIVSGLHALYLPILRRSMNLKIYLDIDENLRRHLKIKRDVSIRGHSLEKVLDSLERRERDASQYIRPQVQHADLVFSLQPINDNMLDNLSANRELRYKLGVRYKNSLNELSLTRTLVGVCGLHVDMHVSGDGSEVELLIDGETTASDVAIAAKMICARALEFLDIEPK